MFLSSFNWYWPEWNHRAKISIGILEFFLDIVSFNPNALFVLADRDKLRIHIQKRGQTNKLWQSHKPTRTARHHEAALVPKWSRLCLHWWVRGQMRAQHQHMHLEFGTSSDFQLLQVYTRLSGRQLERHRHAGARVKELRAAQVVLEQWKQFAQGERNAVELWKTQALSDSVELLEKLVWLCNCDQ